MGVKLFLVYFYFLYSFFCFFFSLPFHMESFFEKVKGFLSDQNFPPKKPYIEPERTFVIQDSDADIEPIATNNNNNNNNNNVNEVSLRNFLYGFPSGSEFFYLPEIYPISDKHGIPVFARCLIVPSDHWKVSPSSSVTRSRNSSTKPNLDGRVEIKVSDLKEKDCVTMAYLNQRKAFCKFWKDSGDGEQKIDWKQWRENYEKTLDAFSTVYSYLSEQQKNVGALFIENVAIDKQEQDPQFQSRDRTVKNIRKNPFKWSGSTEHQDIHHFITAAAMKNRENGNENGDNGDGDVLLLLGNNDANENEDDLPYRLRKDYNLNSKKVARPFTDCLGSLTSSFHNLLINGDLGSSAPSIHFSGLPRIEGISHFYQTPLLLCQSSQYVDTSPHFEGAMLAAGTLFALYNECLESGENLWKIEKEEISIEHYDSIQRLVGNAFKVLRSHAIYVTAWKRATEKNVCMASANGVSEKAKPGSKQFHPQHADHLVPLDERHTMSVNDVGLNNGTKGLSIHDQQIDTGKNMTSLPSGLPSLHHPQHRKKHSKSSVSSSMEGLFYFLSGNREKTESVKRCHQISTELFRCPVFEVTPEFNAFMSHLFHALEQKLYMARVMYNVYADQKYKEMGGGDGDSSDQREPSDQRFSVKTSDDDEYAHLKSKIRENPATSIHIFWRETEIDFFENMKTKREHHNHNNSNKNNTNNNNNNNNNNNDNNNNNESLSVKSSNVPKHVQFKICVSDWILSSFWMELYAQYSAAQKKWHSYELITGSPSNFPSYLTNQLIAYQRCCLGMAILHSCRYLFEYLESQDAMSPQPKVVCAHGQMISFSDSENSTFCLDGSQHFKSMGQIDAMDNGRLWLSGKYLLLIALEMVPYSTNEDDHFLPVTIGDLRLRTTLRTMLNLFTTKCAQFKYTDSSVTIMQEWEELSESITTLLPDALNISRCAIVRQSMQDVRIRLMSGRN